MIKPTPEGNLNHEKSSNISILLADDHPLLRQALRQVLEKQPDLDVVAEVENGEEAVSMALKLMPDVIIMDISMPVMNGLEATRQIKAKLPDTSILVLTVHDDSEHILSILEAGAEGYLTKSVFGDEVIHAIRGVCAGETVMSASISRQVIKYALRHTTKSIPMNTGERITSKELNILRMTARGLSNKDIAQELDISHRTVKSHLSDIFSKLNVASRTEAVITALKVGILNMSDLD